MIGVKCSCPLGALGGQIGHRILQVRASLVPVQGATRSTSAQGRGALHSSNAYARCESAHLLVRPSTPHPCQLPACPASTLYSHCIALLQRHQAMRSAIAGPPCSCFSHRPALLPRRGTNYCAPHPLNGTADKHGANCSRAVLSDLSRQWPDLLNGSLLGQGVGRVPHAEFANFK